MTLFLFLLACGDPGTEAADACEPVACPAGTAVIQSASASSGFELGAALNPATYSGDIAVKTFGEGECAYACESIESCPDGTWPVLTASCFTCATLDADGDVVQGTCGAPATPVDPDLPPGGPCSADAECPWGFTCHDDPFATGGPTCAESCSSLAGGPDCKAGFVCDDTGMCVIPECTRDADCPMGDTCDAGVFGEFRCKSRCSTDNDCKADYVCSSAGACVIPECVTDDDCPSGDCTFNECDSAGCSTVGGASWGFLAVLPLLGFRRQKGRVS